MKHGETKANGAGIEAAPRGQRGDAERLRRLAVCDAILEGGLPCWEHLAALIESEPAPDPDRGAGAATEPPRDFAPNPGQDPRSSPDALIG